MTDKVEQVVAACELVNRGYRWTQEEAELIRSLNPHQLAQVQQRCLARAAAWEESAKMVKAIANGRREVA
jgi:hypothetical protein